ncbi:hypothetical protein Tdes44962_MAKER00441, partial [Teratosphaeria destructans]
GGAGAEVQGDEGGGGDGLAEVRGDGFGDEGVGEAVEAVFAEVVFGRDGGVDGVGAGGGGEGGVEGVVEEGDVGGPGAGVVHGFDDGEGAGVVEGREGREGFEVVIGVLVDADGFVVVAAVDDAVAGEVDVVRVLEGGEVWVGGEVVEDMFVGGLLAVDVGGEGLVLDAVGAAVVLKGGRGRGEACDLDFCELVGGGVVGGVGEDGDFDGGGARVDGEDNFAHFGEGWWRGLLRVL